MEKKNSSFRFDLILIFVVILLGPATGLLISKTNILDKYEFFNFLRPEVNVVKKDFFSKKHEIMWSYHNPCEDIKNGFQFTIENKDSYKKLFNVIKKFEPDVIINTIGLVSVDACETNPKFAQLLNTDFTKSIINNCTYFIFD